MNYAPRDKYLAGRTLTEEVHRFAFPRTGSHLFTYSLSGLFDLVTFPHAHLHNAEAIARQAEINPEVRYALDLREEGSTCQLLFVNAVAGGVHGRPFASDKRRMVLIRHPLPTLYSLYRVNVDRWGATIDDRARWLEEQLGAYLAFYHAAFDVLAADPERSLLVRYEELTSGPGALESVVRFVGLRPKLSPGFVHWLTCFQRFARPDGDAPRTFYRAGDATAYAADPDWTEPLRGIDRSLWQRFGYGAEANGQGR